MPSLAIAATLLIATVLAVRCSEDEAATSASRSASDSTEASTSFDETRSSGRCDFPPFRPASLPWLEPSQPVPAPSRERFEGYAQLDWHAGDSYVVLWQVSESLGGAGEPAPPLPNGAAGYLYEGSSDEDIAQWAIVWAEAQADGCNQTTLSLYSPKLTKLEGKEEILRLAASLTTLDTPPEDAAPAAISTEADPIYPGGDECHSPTLCWSAGRAMSLCRLESGSLVRREALGSSKAGDAASISGQWVARAPTRLSRRVTASSVAWPGLRSSPMASGSRGDCPERPSGSRRGRLRTRLRRKQASWPR